MSNEKRENTKAGRLHSMKLMLRIEEEQVEEFDVAAHFGWKQHTLCRNCGRASMDDKKFVDVCVHCQGEFKYE